MAVTVGVGVGVAGFFPICTSHKLNRNRNFMPSLEIGGKGGKSRSLVTKFSATNAKINNISANAPMELNVDEAKVQLEALKREADQARAKANATRARFMRLTEAVEKLQLQALANVKSGKEYAARETLLEKRKVMQALEKSKRRAEILDEFLRKLGEAISAKEAYLIKILASNSLDMDNEKGSEGPVRVVSSAEDTSATTQNLKEHLSLDPGNNKSDMDENEMRTDLSDSAKIQNQINQEGDAKDLIKGESGNMNDHLVAFFKGIDSYQDFLIDLDQKIAGMESELQTLLKFSSLLLEDEAERLSNRKVKTAMEILGALQDVRARIAGALGNGRKSI